MLTLSVSISESASESVPRIAQADVVEVVDEGVFRAEIGRFELADSRSVKIVAHGCSLAGCFAIVVADGDLVLAQVAGRVDPYLNLWIRVDSLDLFAHLERETQSEEDSSVTPGHGQFQPA